MQRPSILVVEDERIVAMDIQDRLVRLGYEVFGLASSGQQALEMTAGTRLPDLVLMDIHLEGGMDGIEAARILGQERGLPVVFLTAHADDATLQRAKVTQPFGYVIKPFEERELHSAIEISVYRHRVAAELARRDERLRQAQKLEAVGLLAGGMSQHFANLLTAMSGYVRLLRSLDAGHADVPGTLDRMEAAIDRGTALVAALRSFTGRGAGQPERLAIDEVVLGMMPILRGLVSEGIRIKTELAAGGALVLADRDQVEQVLMNLALNACDAMPSGGALTLTTGLEAPREIDEPPRAPGGPPGACGPGGAPHGWAVLAVTDTGCGMDEETRERVFEPFFTTKSGARGPGLGLSVVHGIAEQAGGRVAIDSAPGKGTTVSVSLRVCEVVEPPATGREVPAWAPAAAPGRPSTVLLVEDEATTRDCLSRLLADSGYAVISAAEAQEAVALAERHGGRIDLLVAGIVLPGLDGREVVGRLAPVHPEMRVLYMTGQPDVRLTDPSALGPGTGFLMKPFKTEALLAKVQELLEATRAEE
jgi:signal transduction histidine kinase